MNRHIAILILLCAFTAKADAQTKIPSLAEAAADLAHRYDTCYGAKDAACMAGLYIADGELVSPAGDIVRGHEALETYYRKRFASGSTAHHIVVLETNARGDLGYSVAGFSVSVPPRTEQGHIAAVYLYDATGWHYALVQPSVKPER